MMSEVWKQRGKEGFFFVGVRIELFGGLGFGLDLGLGGRQVQGQKDVDIEAEGINVNALGISK